MKVNITQLHFQIWWLMATSATDGAMRSEEWEFRGRVIKPRKVFPRCDCVTRFAAGRLAATNAQHSFSELSLVRITMTCGARAILKSILGHIFELRRQSWFVTITTRNRKVRACQIESCAPMHY